MIKYKNDLRNFIIHNIILKEDAFDYYQSFLNQLEDYLRGMEPSYLYYANNRGTSVEKARNDDRCGKISEIYVDYFLKKYYDFPGGGVDFKIRKGREKGWGSDLLYDQHPSFNFAVKSCSLLYNNDYSWVFQINNKNGIGGKDPIFSSSEEICFFVINKNTKVGIVASSPIKKIYHLFKDPFLQRLKGLKKCIYYRDLKTVNF